MALYLQAKLLGPLDDARTSGKASTKGAEYELIALLQLTCAIELVEQCW